MKLIVVKDQNILNLQKITHWSATNSILLTQLLMRSCIGVGNINIRIREQDEKDCFCQNIRPLGGGGRGLDKYRFGQH